MFFFFFNHWSIDLFQSNQRFEAIEFMDRLVSEKLYIFCINLYAEILIPVSTVSAGNAWDQILDPSTKKRKCLHFPSLAAKASETKN